MELTVSLHISCVFPFIWNYEYIDIYPLEKSISLVGIIGKWLFAQGHSGYNDGFVYFPIDFSINIFDFSD